MPGIEFEDEDVIDFLTDPYSTVDDEKEEEKQRKEVASVDLTKLASLHRIESPLPEEDTASEL